MKIFSKKKYSDDELVLIENEHLKSYLRLFKSTLIVQTLFPLILSYVFYSLIPATVLFGWLSAVLLLTALRGVLTFYWFKIEFNAKKTQLFEHLSLLLSLLAGCLWGATALIIDFNIYPEESIFLYIIVFGLTAGSVGIGSYWFEYFLIYNLSVFTIYIATNLIGIPDPYYLLAVSLILFLIFMQQITVVFHRSNAENIWLITRNEKIADRLSEKMEQAEEFSASRTRFLASASHDLRQPVQALNFFLSALEPQLKSQESKNIFAKIENCTDGINDLLSAILDISKLDAKTLIPKEESCYLNDILDNLKQQFVYQATEKNLTLIVEGAPVYIKSDSILLQRIISNLISNAITYTNKGKVHIWVTENKNNASIHISDTGIGLDEHEQIKIFEEFYQVDNPERDKNKGLGLGLSIVSKLCILMNIPIELQSQKGTGSNVTITLPTCEAPTHVIKPKIRTPQYQLQSKRILVIEDDASIRESLIELLQKWHFEVITTQSEEEACKVIEETAFIPDLVIADYRLRNHKTGVDAVNKVKTILSNNELPVIIISGDTEPARLKEVSLSGYELLHKPVKPAQLRMLIHRKLS
jgi:signal transduction histidine kinase/CheY-like chemotaxis protein